jgi:glycine cleavage system H lipoate-binding protein
MSNLQLSKRIAKTSLLYLVLAAGLIVALPLLAGLAYAVRFLIPVLIVGTLVAVAFSPALRRWFADEADDAPDYKGLPFPTASLRVHPAHSWAKVSADQAEVGVDALALTALGSVSSVEPPPVGNKVEQGDVLFSLCRGERRLHVKAPFSGIVVGINSEAVANPAAIAQSPYGAGWIVRLQDVHPGQAATPLLSGTSLRRWFRAEVDRLTTLLSVTGPATAATMADGGKLAPDLANQIDDGKWAEVAAQLFGNHKA